MSCIQSDFTGSNIADSYSLDNIISTFGFDSDLSIFSIDITGSDVAVQSNIIVNTVGSCSVDVFYNSVSNFNICTGIDCAFDFTFVNGDIFSSSNITFCSELIQNNISFDSFDCTADSPGHRRRGR